MERRDRRGRSAGLALACVVVLAGCADDAAPAADAPLGPGEDVAIPAPEDFDPARLAPLAGLPACPAAPTGDPEADTGPLPLPADAVVTSASEDGGLLSAQGYTPRTPVEVLVDYLALDGWTALSAEDEVFEAELLVERDGLRVFAKAQATCDRGSAFVLFGSTDEALVPAPRGAAG